VTEEYRVPKRPVPIELKLAWQHPKRLCLYVADHAERHTGGEYPSDLMNGVERFIPAVDGDGRLMLFQRTEVMVLSVSAEHENGAGESGGEDVFTAVAVKLVLEDDTRVAGAMEYFRPQGQRRVQDYLKTAEQFIPVRESEKIHLVNRDKIVSVSFADS